MQDTYGGAANTVLMKCPVFRTGEGVEAAYWKQEAMRLQAEVEALILEKHDLQAEVVRLASEIVQRQCEVESLTGEKGELARQVEDLKGKQMMLAQMLFGRKSEKQAPAESESPEPATSESATSEASAPETSQPEKRPRGQQRGAPGHGRHLRKELPVRTITCELSKGRQRCFKCGKPFKTMPFPEISEEIDWILTAWRNRYERLRYCM